MRKFLVSAALVTATIAAAAPASAQWQRPQGNAYGYDNYGQVRRYDARIDQIQRQIRRLDVRNVIGHNEAQRLAAQAQNVEQRLRQFAYNGLNNQERYDIENRIARLEQRVQRVVANETQGRNGRYSNDRDDRYGRDRDRDGRDDRFEDDRGRNPG